MQIFNLTQYASIKADKYINTHCGGRYTRKEAYDIGGIGIGRLRYKGGIGNIDSIDTQEQFRANLETFRQGLGVYVRSLSYNFLLAIPSAEILRIHFSKELDLVKEARFSWTRQLMSMGMPYHYAKVMLLDQEIEKVHESYLHFETLGMDMKFLVKRNDPRKLLHYFEQGPYSECFTSDLKGYQFV